MKTGKLIDKLADSPLGAIVTHAMISKSGKHVITAESGHVLVWDLFESSVCFKQEQSDLKQLFFMDKDTMFIAVSKIGGAEMR
jgi:hypothetical protein